jgi:hypothetical protein
MYETFMFDHVALVLDMAAVDALGRDVVGKLMSVGVGRLRVPGIVRGLIKRHREDEDENGSVEEGIMKTNAFGTQVAGVDTRAVFPVISVRSSLIQPPNTTFTPNPRVGKTGRWMQ